MADLTNRGKPLDDAAAKLKSRRAELEIMTLKRQILSDEIDIEAMQLEAARKRESIMASLEKIAAIQSQFGLKE